MTTITTNPFARRHTKGSGLSYFDGSFTDLEDLVADHLVDAKPGYRDGVLLVPVPAEGFVSGVVRLQTGTEVDASVAARRDGEEPVLDARADGEPLPARYVEVVLYRHDVLAEGGDASSDAEWEIISVNASPTDGPTPMHPTAMARNQLGLAGGTAAEYSTEEWAESALFWATHAMAKPAG